MTTMQGYNFHLTIPARNYRAAIDALADYAPISLAGELEIDNRDVLERTLREWVKSIGNGNGVWFDLDDERLIMDDGTGVGDQYWSEVTRIRELTALAGERDYVRIQEDDGAECIVVKLGSLVDTVHPVTVYPDMPELASEADVERVKEFLSKVEVSA